MCRWVFIRVPFSEDVENNFALITIEGQLSALAVFFPLASHSLVRTFYSGCSTCDSDAIPFTTVGLESGAFGSTEASL